MATIHIQQGDLTKCKVDAIVNAANNDLILGGGLAGAIARAAGPEVQAACDAYGPVEVGQAAITGAGRLPAKFVIHQASMRLGGHTTAGALRASTKAVLELAEKNGVRTLALPATGTGIAGFALRDCAQIMLEELQKHLANPTGLTDVYFVLFDEQAATAFRETFRKLFGTDAAR
ncbi:MAG: macro domain-containing protein [Planctomycetota bacterium]|nr:macro domain-containing protein [Planctomycetota bacterium]